MPNPTDDELVAMLTQLDLTYPPHWLASAGESVRSLRPRVEAMRAIPLAFVGDVAEPAAALTWLERGGGGL